MEKDYRSLEQKIKNIIIEAAEFRNTNARLKIANVARPGDADPTSEKSKLAKQSEIKTKIIDEAEEKKKEEEKPEDKKESKAGASKSETEFTGGKTQVNTEPKTDDKIDDESSEKSKGDKAAAKANKEIGKKPNPVKEETSMFGTPKNFGLSASLIAAVSEATKMRKEADANLAKVNDIASNLKGMATTQPGKLPNTDAGGPDMFKSNAPSIVKKEALHPNQRKLDVAPPKGKLTAADFAKLRKEEIELDESNKPAPLSDKETTAVKNHLIKKYGKGKVSFNTEHGAHFVSHDDGYEENHHMISRDGGKLKVSHHMTVSNEETNLDELSKGTMKSYVKKALDPSSEKSISNLASRGGFEQGISGDDEDSGQKYDRKSVVRSKGVQRAVNKLTKEEVEELEELSKATVGSYVKRSAQDLKNLEAGREKGESLPAHIRRNRMQNNRTVGTIRGVNKLTGAAKVPANEETDLSLEEGDLSLRTLYHKMSPWAGNQNPVHKAIEKVHGKKALGHLKKAVDYGAAGHDKKEDEHFSKAMAASGDRNRSSATGGRDRSANRARFGITPARKKTGAAKVPANEEVQFSEEEIARITEIAKGL